MSSSTLEIFWPSGPHAGKLPTELSKLERAGEAFADEIASKTSEMFRDKDGVTMPGTYYVVVFVDVTLHATPLQASSFGGDV